MFEEILRKLKILLGGSNKAGLLKIWIKGEQIFFEIARDAEVGVFGERSSVLDTPAVDCSRRTFSRKP